MPENTWIVPIFAPPKFYPKSDEEFATAKPIPSRKEKRSSKCLVSSLAAFVFLSAIALVFASVVLRAKTPAVLLTSVEVGDLKYGNSPTPSFNMTLAAELRIKNHNFGKYEFETSTASVLYKDVIVGEAKLRQGLVQGKETERMNIMVNARSQRVSSSETKNLTSDISSGMLELSSYARLKGKVQLIKKIKKKTTAVLNCTMTLNLTRRSVQDLFCR